VASHDDSIHPARHTTADSYALGANTKLSTSGYARRLGCRSCGSFNIAYLLSGAACVVLQVLPAVLSGLMLLLQQPLLSGSRVRQPLCLSSAIHVSCIMLYTPATDCNCRQDREPLT
jgi:hypothetical protein